MRKVFRFTGLFQNKQWISPAWVVLDGNGHIQAIYETQPEGEVEQIDGYAIPGFQNAHSHAFQYAMAGHTEHVPHGSKGDDFWSWRERMYQLAMTLSPEQIEAIAGMVYAEMVRVGYTSVVEFHYLHHDPKGKPYTDSSELGRRLLQAASKVGIRITLVPIFYQYSGFEKAPPTTRQIRFLSKDLQTYFRLLESSQKAVDEHPSARLGVGVHSLRAVGAEELCETFASAPKACPRHIHIAEQQREVDACLQVYGKRPVQWLLENVSVNENCHLIHATHCLASELEGISKSQASVVLCPSTEGNLGDGRFPLMAYQTLGGKWSIGTDSHVGLCPHEELRWLDYTQRMEHQKRNVLCAEGDDSGVVMFCAMHENGKVAMGRAGTEPFARDEAFDAVIYDAQHPLLSITPSERRMSAILYGCGDSARLGTMVQGNWVVRRQKHIKYDDIYKMWKEQTKSIF